MNIKYTLEECYELLEEIGVHVEHVDTDRRYWFIRTQGGEYFQEFFLDGFVGIGDEDVPCVAEQDRTPDLIKSEPHTRDFSRELGEQIVSVCRNVYVDTD